MKVKVKKLLKDDYKIIIKEKGKKGQGELFLRKCVDCKSPFITNDIWDLFCSECRARRYEEDKKILDKLFEKIKKEDTDEIKPIKEKHTEQKAEVSMPKRTCYCYRYCIENPPKIRVPKFNEKYAFLKSHKKTCVNKIVALKLFELIARGNSISYIMSELHLAKGSIITYIYQLIYCGLVIKVKNEYLINPAIKYELK